MVLNPVSPEADGGRLHLCGARAAASRAEGPGDAALADGGVRAERRLRQAEEAGGGEHAALRLAAEGRVVGDAPRERPREQRLGEDRRAGAGDDQHAGVRAARPGAVPRGDRPPDGARADRRVGQERPGHQDAAARRLRPRGRPRLRHHGPRLLLAGTMSLNLEWKSWVMRKIRVEMPFFADRVV